MNPALAIALIQAVPSVVSELGAWYARVQRARAATAMPDGPAKEAAIQALLIELRGQTGELEKVIAERSAPGVSAP